jgi:hypothetical protein
MRPEIELMVLGSRPRPTVAQADRCRELVATEGKSMDWGYLVDQAYRHRVLPSLAATLDELRLFAGNEARVPMRELFVAHLLYTRSRNAALLDELAQVLGVIEDAGHVAAVRKGAYLAPEVYRDRGRRPMSDLDLLVEPGSANDIAALLGSLGYRLGRLSTNGREVEPLERGTAVFARLYGNTLPLLVRPTSDPYVGAFVVDLCVQQFLPRSGYAIPNDDLRPRVQRRRIAGTTGWVLTPEEFLLDLLAHIYKESTTLRYIHLLKHQRLLQYLDVVEFASTVDWTRFLALVREYGVSRPAYFGLAHAQLLYPDAIDASVLVELRVDEPGFLDEFGGVDLGRPLSWQSDFLSRFFSADRTVAAPPTASPM